MPVKIHDELECQIEKVKEERKKIKKATAQSLEKLYQILNEGNTEDSEEQLSASADNVA